MNKKYLVAAVGAALSVAGVSAHAIDAKLSGQVARGLMYADDGVYKELHHVDAADATRFRFTGTGDLMSGLKAGVQFEVEFISNGSSAVTNTANGSGRSTVASLAERHQQVYFEGAFGRISMGQSDGAANGNTETDLSGSGFATSMVMGDWGGSIVFRTAAGTAGPSISSAISQQDFESRYDRLRYDTPALGPVVVSASTGVKGGFSIKEIGVKLNSDMGSAGKLAAAVGYSEEKTSTFEQQNETTGGSVSWLLPMGLSFTFGMSELETSPTRKGKWNYLKADYTSGQHSIGVDMATGDDQAQNDDEAEMIGVGYVYKPQKWAEIYAVGRLFSLDRPGTEFGDIKIVSVGSRLKF